MNHQKFTSIPNYNIRIEVESPVKLHKTIVKPFTAAEFKTKKRQFNKQIETNSSLQSSHYVTVKADSKNDVNSYIDSNEVLDTVAQSQNIEPEIIDSLKNSPATFSFK